MIQFFARVVELREEKYVKYDGKITMDSPSREFLEMTFHRSPVTNLRIGSSQVLHTPKEPIESKPSRLDPLDGIGKVKATRLKKVVLPPTRSASKNLKQHMAKPVFALGSSFLFFYPMDAFQCRQCPQNLSYDPFYTIIDLRPL